MDEASLAECLSVLTDVCNDYNRSRFFLVPPLSVLEEHEKAAYMDLIPLQNHRDLVQIRNKLEGNREYTTPEDFMADMELMLENSKLFCKERYKAVYKSACDLQKNYQKLCKKKLIDNKKPTSQASSSLTSSSSGFAITLGGGKKDGMTIKLGIKKPPTTSIAPVPLQQPNIKKTPPKVTVLDVPIVNFGSKCEKIMQSLSGLPNSQLLLAPVNLVTFPDYAIRVPNPIDFSTISSKLPGTSKSSADESVHYQHHNEFAKDVRRVYGNFVRYNFHSIGITSKLRKEMVANLHKFESFWTALAGQENSGKSQYAFSKPFVYLKQFMQCMEAVFKLPSSSGNNLEFAVQWFIDPIRKYFMDEITYGEYLDIVGGYTMDLGSIISKVVEGDYTSTTELYSDFDLIVSNCEKYWTKMAQKNGSQEITAIEAVYVNDAKKVHKTFMDTFEAAITKAAPSAGSKSMEFTETVAFTTHAVEKKLNKSMPSQSKLAAAAPVESIDVGGRNSKLTKFYRETFKHIMTQLKKHYLRPVNIAENSEVEVPKVLTCGPFLKPVDASIFPDYYSIISQPIDLTTIEKKFGRDEYTNLYDVVADMILLRSNAHTYNVGIEGLEVRVMADALLDYFKYLVKYKLLDLQFTDPSLYELVKNKKLEALMKEKDAVSVLNYVADEEAKETKKVKKTSQSSRVDESLLDQSAVSGFGDYDEFMDIEALGPSSSLPMAELAVVPQRELVGWENEASSIWRAMARHAFVDVNKGSVVSNFFVPVCEMFPEIAAAYLSIVKKPMDMSTLQLELYRGTIADKNEFYNKLKSIFANAMDYNSSHSSSDFAVRLVRRCAHLVQYTKWLALENFKLDETDVAPAVDVPVAAVPPAADAEQPVTTSTPSVDAVTTADTAVSSNVDVPVASEMAPSTSNVFEYLTISDRDSERARRLEIVSAADIISTTECKRLIKQVERSTSATKAEKIKVSYFSVPVDEKLLSDYALYVKKPIDLSTVKVRLEGPTSSTYFHNNTQLKVPPRYKKYGEFISDLRLIFQNAIKYNGAHLTSDSTGISRKVYDAAFELQERLEANIPSFTLDLADRILRKRLENDELYAREEQIRKRHEEEVREITDFSKEQMEKVKLYDEAFAKDYDIERKKSETRRVLKAHEIAQLRLDGMFSLGAYDDEDLDEEALRLADTIVKQKTHGLGGLGGISDRDLKIPPHAIRGFGGCTQLSYLPVKILAYLETKNRVYEEAWDRWTFLSSRHHESHETTKRKRDEGDEESKGGWVAIEEESPMDVVVQPETSITNGMKLISFKLQAAKK